MSKVVKCVETIEVGGKTLATKGREYDLIVRRRHPIATHGHVVIKGDDDKLHTFPETYFR